MVVLFFLCGLSACSIIKDKQNERLTFQSLTRNQYEILDTVTGVSTTERILFGLVTIVDNKNWRVVGIPFFMEEKDDSVSSFFTRNTAGRALFKMLARYPDADKVLQQNTKVETKGFPLLWDIEKITYSGKAIRIKTDKELQR